MGKKYSKKKRIEKKRQKNLQIKAISVETQSPSALKIGNSIVVKQGTLDPDYKIDMGGWQGKITEIEKSGDGQQLVGIKWDIITLKNMLPSFIVECEKDNLSWSEMYLYASEVEPTDPRGNEKDVSKIEDTLFRKYISPLLTDDGEMATAIDDLVWENNKKILLATVTGEPFQPARIYYQLFDAEKIQIIFSKLRCMDYDRNQSRWVWLYHAESKKIKFQTPYVNIPRKLHPIVIGSFFLKNENEMFLNVNSFERVTKAITFFNKYLPRTTAKVNGVEIVNKIFSSIDGSIPRHEDYFDKRPVVKRDSEMILNQISNIASSVDDPMERLKLALSHTEIMAKEPLPEVERLPTHFYEEGIESLKTSLMMRTIIAHEQWSGNKDYSFYDLMQKITPKL